MSLSLQARRTLLTDTTHTSRHRNDTLMCYGLIPVRGGRWSYR